MKRDGSCPKCGSHNIVANGALLDPLGTGTEGLSVAVHAKPASLFRRHAQVSRLAAWVCGDCGYTELYAGKPADLYAAHEDASRQSSAFAEPSVAWKAGNYTRGCVILVGLSVALTLLVLVVIALVLAATGDLRGLF